MTAENTAPIEFSYTFTKRFLWDALKRDILWKLGVAVLIVLVAIAALGWALGVAPWRSPMLPALIGGALAGVIVVPLKLRSIVARTDSYWARLSPDRIIRYRLLPDAIEVEMPNGTARHQWHGMRRLWRYKDIWLLEIVKNTSVLLPADAPEEARAFVVERCREAGVRL